MIKHRRNDLAAGGGASPARQSDRIRKGIEDDILSGALSPGSRLDEEALAARFNVSRTPIRETLMQLSYAGLVELRPRQSAVVAVPTVEAVIEMFELCLEMEKMCARLAARRMTKVERRGLSTMHELAASHVENRDVEAYVLANRDFHHAIYAGCHNAFMAQQAQMLFGRLQPYRRHVMLRPGQIVVSHREHGDIAAAVIAGDDAASEAHMMKHASLQDGAFLDFIAMLQNQLRREVKSGGHGR